MDTARPTRRPAALLALALAATTCLSVLVPASAALGAAQEGAGTAAVARATTVVVTSAAGGVEAAAAAVLAAGGTVLHRLPLVGGVGATLPAGAVLAPSYQVSANLPMSLAGGKDRPSRSASTVRGALHLGPAKTQGAGVRIAVVDTGVDDHPDLAGRLEHVDVSGSWEPGERRDALGHGTFVAGAAAGSGSASDGRYAGVAPGADVVDIRVADDSGATDLLTVLRGLEKADELDVDVVNLSMSSGSLLPYQLDPLTVALSRLWADGIVVVVPSGNDGDRRRSVTSPGTDPTLLTVGALDERLTADRRDDVVPAFSGRGPAPQGVAKPDLVAPGQSLVSLRSPGSDADTDNPGSVVDGAYFRGSGTSFSTALVAGTAAVLLEQRRDLRPDQVKALVTGTAYDAKGLKDPTAGGAGGLDVAAALAAPTPDVPDAAVGDGPPPGEDVVWEQLVQALLTNDQQAAASSWSDLSPEAHRWAAHRWAALTPAAHRWAASSWSASRWAADPEWQARGWAASSWSASRWAASSWSASSWSASRWAASSWSASSWSASSWSASRWAASSWSTDTWQ